MYWEPCKWRELKRLKWKDFSSSSPFHSTCPEVVHRFGWPWCRTYQPCRQREQKKVDCFCLYICKKKNPYAYIRTRTVPPLFVWNPQQGDAVRYVRGAYTSYGERVVRTSRLASDVIHSFVRSLSLTRCWTRQRPPLGSTSAAESYSFGNRYARRTLEQRAEKGTVPCAAGLPPFPRPASAQRRGTCVTVTCRLPVQIRGNGSEDSVPVRWTFAC